MSKLKTGFNFTVLVLVLSLVLICILNLVPTKSNKISTSNTQSTQITPIPIIEISWQEAQTILDSCQIQTIFQKRNLEVTLTNKDNQVYKTKEPKFNDIVYKINHLPSVCTDTVNKITE